MTFYNIHNTILLSLPFCIYLPPYSLIRSALPLVESRESKEQQVLCE